MYFVKPLFFEFEPIKIANVTENGSLNIELARFIALYEKQCLLEILGECLYKELIDSFELLSGSTEFTLKNSATEPIKRLVNGYSYTAPPQTDCEAWTLAFLFGGCGCGCGSETCTTRVWPGFIKTDQYLIGGEVSESKSSFIADYIYYHYLLINRSLSTGSGQQVLTGENSTTVSNFSKRIDRYNEFVSSVIGRVNETCLYQFLHDNKADYPTWKRNCYLTYKTKF